MNELALFAGAGGGILGGKILGWRTVCAVEIEEYRREVLIRRQNEGYLEPFPIWDDVETFDGYAWRGLVDVVSGGFPCQDISVAGKGAGIEGERSGLWREMARIIGEVRPRYVFVENSPMLIRRGLTTVLGDLAEMGYDARWGCFTAENTGAFHLRERIFILAYARHHVPQGRQLPEKRHEHSQGRTAWGKSASYGVDVADTSKGRWQKCESEPEKKDDAGKGDQTISNANENDVQRLEQGPQQGRNGRSPGLHDREAERKGWREWPSESGLDRVVDGMADRVERIKAIGDGQVPRVVALAWRVLSGEVNV